MKIFSEQHEMFRATVRAFVDKEIAPHVEAWEQAGRMPRWIWPRMGALGQPWIPASCAPRDARPRAKHESWGNGPIHFRRRAMVPPCRPSPGRRGPGRTRPRRRTPRHSRREGVRSRGTGRRTSRSSRRRRGRTSPRRCRWTRTGRGRRRTGPRIAPRRRRACGTGPRTQAWRRPERRAGSAARSTACPLPVASKDPHPG